MDLKLIFSEKIKFFWALQYWCTWHLNRMVVSYWKIQFKKIFPTFPIHFGCEFKFTFSFWRSGTFWAYGSNSKVVQLDKTFHMIYISIVVQGVSSTSPSAIRVKGLSKNRFHIRTQGPKLPSGRSRKVENSTMNN